MNKEFIPYEEALALKELGFDEPCFGYYTDNKFEFFADIRNCNTNSEFGFYPTAPTYSQAFRWFREKHNLIGNPIPLSLTFPGKVTHYGWAICSSINVLDLEDDNQKFKTYEEAEFACIKKLIETVKNK
jgi:hypothetical protein